MKDIRTGGLPKLADKNTKGWQYIPHRLYKATKIYLSRNRKFITNCEEGLSLVKLITKPTLRCRDKGVLAHTAIPISKTGGLYDSFSCHTSI